MISHSPFDGCHQKGALDSLPGKVLSPDLKSLNILWHDASGLGFRVQGLRCRF